MSIAERARSDRWFMIVTAFGFLGFAILIYCLFSSGGSEISGQPHPEDDMIALITGPLFGILASIAILLSGPISVRRVMHGILAFVLISVVWGLAFGLILLDYQEHQDFSGPSVKTYVSELPIETAEIFHSKSTQYRVWLRDYGAFQFISQDDYISAFGNVERVNPKGYCIRAPIQTSKTATRILGFGELPPGSLARCSRVS